MSHVRTAPRSAGLIKAVWLAPAGLLLLGMLPIVAGAFRLSQLSGMSDVGSWPFSAGVPGFHGRSLHWSPAPRGLRVK
jgi:hypothetical protein